MYVGDSMWDTIFYKCTGKGESVVVGVCMGVVTCSTGGSECEIPLADAQISLQRVRDGIEYMYVGG